MSVEGSSHLGPDEPVKRKGAERQLEDVSCLVLFLVEAALPITLSTVLHDTIMAWATEALERAGEPEGHRADGEPVRVFDFEHLIESGRQDVQIGGGLDSANLSVEAAARQLDRARPNSREWYAAKQVLDQAVSRLRDVSSRLLRRAGAEEDPLEGVRVGVRSQRPGDRPIQAVRSTSGGRGRSPDRNRAQAGHRRTPPGADAARRSSRSTRFGTR